jgi:CoA:oxalate CoA-transferase
MLTGITVLDFTRVLAGPYCTRLLADLGARVIKVERPGAGDETRRGFLQIDETREDQATYFIRVNAGKLSIAIDLAHPDAKPLVVDLARAVDVVVENFVPGVAEKLGFGYEALAAVKPDLVYCSISGFGQTGPWRRSPAFAHIIDAVSGMMHLARHDDPSPRVAYLQAADVLAGTHAFGAIVSALFQRERTGKGAYLDVSMLECVVAAEDITYGSVLNGGAEYRGPRAGMVVHRIGDRYVALQTVGAPDLWARLVKAFDHAELAADPRFATPKARRDRWPEIHGLIVGWLERFATVEQAIDLLAASRVPCAPVLSPAEVAQHPQLEARNAFPEIPHATRGSVRVTATPFQVDHRRVGPAGPAPFRPGEHTRQILGEVLDYPASRIDGLLERGVVAVP